MAATLDNRNIDQGYAWIILLASFTSLFILAVLVYSTGMVYTAVLEHVNKDLVRASWVGSTLMGTYLFSGPVAGMMTSTFGCRTMAVVGGILILLGMTAAFFCKTVLTLILTYGVVTGLGIGFVHNAVIVVVGYYFQKRIAFASGISTSGAGLGMLAGAPIVRAILDGFGLNGTLLLLGSFGAQTCILGMLLRPSPIEREKSKQCVIADIGGEYDYTFIFSGAVILFGSLVSIGIGIFRRKATTEKKTTVMLLPGSEDQEENHDESVPFNVATSMGYHDECSDQYV